MKYSISSLSVLALLATTRTVVSSHNRDVAQPTKTNRRRHLRGTNIPDFGPAVQPGPGTPWRNIDPYGNGGAEPKSAVQPPMTPYGQQKVGPDTEPAVEPGTVEPGTIEPSPDTPSRRAVPAVEPGIVEPGTIEPSPDTPSRRTVPAIKPPSDYAAPAPDYAAPAGPAGDETGGEITSVELGDADYDYPISDATQMLAKVF